MQSKATHLKALPEATSALQDRQAKHRAMTFAVGEWLEAVNVAAAQGFEKPRVAAQLERVFDHAIERYRKPALSVVEGKDEVRVLGQEGA